MTANANDGPHNVLVVEWEGRKSKVSVVLDLDVRALMNLAANPVEGLSGPTLFGALRRRGGVLNDAVGADGGVVPAWQEFDAESGKRTHLAHHQAGELQGPASGEPAWQEFGRTTGNRTRLGHYQAGQLQDPASGEPARQYFDLATGNRTYLAHYQSGLLQGPANGEAAVQWFDAMSGNRTRLEHYQSGQLQDPASGAPAIQRFDAKSGALIAAERYKQGRLVAALSKQELAQFAAAKGLPGGLPVSLQSFVRPELKPML